MAVTTILATEQVDRIVRRLAHEIVERNRGAERVVVLGIMKRGDALGRRLTEEIGRICRSDVPYASLDAGPYRDDVARTTDSPAALPDLAGRDVVLVDDVLFTGRTVRAALDAVVRFGRPHSIQLAVLVDRGHREYPIQPDYVGRTIPTKHRERVVVRMEPAGVDVVED